MIAGSSGGCYAGAKDLHQEPLLAHLRGRHCANCLMSMLSFNFIL